MNKIPNGWKEKKLKYIAEITSSKRIYEYEYVDSGIPFYRGKEITALKNNQKIENFIYISEKRYNELKEKYGVPSKYDILITAVGTVGNAYTIEDDKPFYFKDGNLLWLKDIKEYPKFVEYLFECNKNILLNNFFGSVQHALTISRLENLTFYFPPLDEQKRIASALSKIDAYLENTIKLIEEKERFKRGIAKKLLTCKEGENIPEARFKGFEDEWEIVKLGDICLINNKSLKENTDKDYKFKYIDLTAVKKGIINFSNDYTTFENAPISARRIINKNDIIMATVRPYLLGHAFIDFEAKDYICSKGFAVLTANSNIEMKYIYQYLYSDDMAKQIKSRLVGSTYPTIRLSDIKELKIKIPKSIKEQEKIGGYLSLLDAEIDNLKKQKELIKEMKRGAMQKLLSGEVRLSKNAFNENI